MSVKISDIKIKKEKLLISLDEELVKNIRKKIPAKRNSLSEYFAKLVKNDIRWNK